MGVILAPANGKGAALRLIEAGAGELYMGFHDDNWTQLFGNADLNRMSGFGEEANIFTFEELCDEVASVLSTCATAKILPRIFCTFNATLYTSAQADYIVKNYLPALAQAGVFGIIVSGPQLIDAARECSLTVVASTICAVYNEDIARFYRNRGVQRVIIPRDLTLVEIASVTNAVPDLEYEAFLMRNGCVFADSHCLGLHRANCPSLCRTLRESSWWEIPLDYVDGVKPDEDAVNRRIESGRIHKERFHENTCGLCALWRLEQMNINAYKVVGRGDSIDDLCRDVTLVNDNLKIAQKSTGEKDYLEHMLRPEGMLTLCTNQGLSCYYPEIRFAEHSEQLVH